MIRIVEADHAGKAYVNPDRVQVEIDKLKPMLRGACSCKIIPTIRAGKLKYTAIFFCFSDESDMMVIVHSGFSVYR